MVIEFDVKVKNGEVYINDHLAGQLAWDEDAIASIISSWLKEFHST